MNRDETINILSILKATYPQSFRNMTAQEGRGTISAWLMDFENVDSKYILMAIKRYKTDITKSFAPNINDIHKILNDMVDEADGTLKNDNVARELTKLPDCCISCTSFGEGLKILKPCHEIICPREKSNHEYYQRLKNKLLSDEKRAELKYIIDNITGEKTDLLSLMGDDTIKKIGN